MNIELYISNKLCDLGSSDLAIALKRQFLNPSQLNTKDAQKSYEIVLPATPINNEIFSYVNVEEVGDKFSIYANARLYVGGVLIIDGKFRLSEILRNGYKGNLGVPALKSDRDVFGDMLMNNAGTWKIDDFEGFESISEYNQKDNSEVIFPLALYGLLPKTPNANGDYTAKNLYDDSVLLDIIDFAPSVNCIQMLKKVFANSGYNLSGTALSDDRLTNLYMSYKNPNDYEFDWGMGKIDISGKWRHYKGTADSFENRYNTNTNESSDWRYMLNLFNSKNNESRIISDTGGHANIKGEKTTLIIPQTGLYKIDMVGTIVMADDNTATGGVVNVQAGTMNDASIELHLIRNMDKSLSDMRFNNKFSRENLDQDINDPDAVFPQPHRVNFIDPKQDRNFISGFSFGRHDNENYRNPLNSDNCNPMAITGGFSWDYAEGVTDRAYSAVYSPNYKRRNGDDVQRFEVDLQNADTRTWRNNDKLAQGRVRQVVWLEKGDRLDLITITRLKTSVFFTYIHDYEMTYDMRIEPFNHYKSWLKVGSDGSSYEPMDWNNNDSGAFVENQIDLIKSLPSEMKVNEFLDNFCKAFNLILYNSGGNNFNLDIKDRGIIRNTSIIIDLDKKASVSRSINQPLNLPYRYDLGFTIDTNEEGYYSSIEKFDEQGEPILSTGDDGGGIFYTGSQESNIITQTSNFSYGWFKDITYSRDGSIMKLPVITDHEIWENDYDYEEMQSNRYFDKALRFWYKSGVKEIDLGLDRKTTIALVSNEYKGNQEQVLNYRNEPNTIMSNYFLLLTNRKHYTVISCYLTPEEYSNLNISLVRFNGDLYNVAEIDGYDPLGRRQCTLKLIRKI